MAEKIVLVDGHSIANRAFYGVPMLTNAKGVHTNAVYGFLNILFRLIDDEKPDYLTVAFDLKAPTFRHKAFSEYKGTRKPMPEELREQIPIIKELVQAFGFQICTREGFEADDILGSLAKKAQADGLEVSLVSGDRDLLQIADEHIKIRIPKTKMGKTEIEDYYPQDVEKAYGVTPAGFIELKALMGDSADNIPGVPKVGAKTATELMVTYGSIDGIYEHIDEISKKSIKQTLMENRDKADLSLFLATIKTDCELDFSYDRARLTDVYTKEAYEMCKELGFKKFLERFNSAGETPAQPRGAEFEKVMLTEFSEVDSFFSKIQNQVGLSVILNNQGGLGAIGICENAQKAFCIPVQGFVTDSYLVGKILDIIKNAGISVFDVKTLFRACGDELEYVALGRNELLFDVKLAAYLINPLGNDYSPGDVALERLNLQIADEKSLFGKVSPYEAYESDFTKLDTFRDYVATLAYVNYMSAEILVSELKETGMYDLYYDMEMPVSYVLYSMEREGVCTDRQALEKYGEDLVEGIETLEQTIYSQAGVQFNINSPKQLGEVLFEKMGLPGGKKTKTGYSTAADVLEKLAADNPVIGNILEYRTLTKLKSTYAEGLSAYIDETERIHSHFNQTITATGRISSTEPNLQNIPTRTELGRQLRKVFTASEGCVLTDADYSQIELRVLAHMSGDRELIEAYNSGSDIHAITAAKVFHKSPEEVTPELRRNAKAVNFGIVYGISSFGLSQDLSISVKEAKQYINDYFETYPGIKSFLDGQVEAAKKNGYVVTAYNRRRPVPEIADKNFMRRAFGERVAMNSPIQGTAADIMKLAMLGVYRELKKQNLKSRLILQIHDELIIDTLIEEKERVEEILRTQMENAASLTVRLEVDLNSGFTWFDAH